MGIRSVKRRCGFCSGGGKVWDDIIGGFAQCTICEGTKFVSIPSNWIKCPDCKGNGKIDFGAVVTYSTCNRCKGTGWCEPPMSYK